LATAGRLAAGLAHEIRNPLSSIAGAVQILSTSPLSEEDRELCGIVSREAGRLEDLVSDMLELSRPRPPHREDTDLLRVVSDVVVLAARSGRAFGDVSVRAIVPEGELIVSADGAQLRQLIWNLVRNAVQASAPGGEVRVRVEEVEGLVLSVEDDGEGIEGNSFEHLFDASYTTRSRGTGIGLAVVKRIADEHGFGLLVDSRAGQGATFRVVLASRRSSRPPTTAAARISVPPQR
jgi:signal transduction histidine kinase